MNQPHKIIRLSSVLTIDFGHYSNDELVALIAAAKTELIERAEDATV